MPANQDAMRIWDLVKETNPDHTRHISYGKRSFTNIDATYQNMQATKLWGPQGTAWGIEPDSVTFQIIEHSTNPIAVIRCVLFYPGGRIFQCVDMPLKPGDDVFKKLLTAARSKALSQLGFGADVYMGKFEDSEYVKQTTERHERSDAVRDTAAAKIEQSQTIEDLDRCQSRLDELTSQRQITYGTAADLQSEIDAKRQLIQSRDE
jgi:hypothetical protein